jgi:hypothetical protein
LGEALACRIGVQPADLVVRNLESQIGVSVHRFRLSS